MRILFQMFTQLSAVLLVNLFFQAHNLFADTQKRNDPVNDLNKSFRSHYAKTRASILQNSGPVIIVRGDNMILINGEQRIEGKLIDPTYHDLKAVAHAPLALYSLLIRNKTPILSDDIISELEKLAIVFERSYSAFDSRLNSKEVEKKQRDILSSCIDFTSVTLKTKKFDYSNLIKFMRSLLNPIQENLELAAKYRINNYRDQIFEWRTELNGKQWEQVVFLIPGSPMARKDNLAVQFCAKLVGEKNEGARIVYAESLFGENEAMLRLATHLFDTKIGEDIFSDPWRMHRDALGPSTARYLDVISLTPNYDH